MAQLCELSSTSTKTNPRDFEVVKLTCKFFVMENETPKKSASESRENPKEECRFCKTKLVIRYGKTAYISTENIFAVSNRKEYDKPEFRGLENKTSSQLCAELGFNVAKSDKSSDRICKPCGRNLRSMYCFYKRLKYQWKKTTGQTLRRAKRRPPKRSEVRLKGSVATRQVDSRGSFPLSHQIDAPPLKLLNDQAEPRNRTKTQQ